MFKAQHYTYIICEDCYSSYEIGANQSTISGFGSSPKIGFYAGFFHFKPINDKFAIRAGGTYNNMGGKVTGYDTPLVIHSVNIPVSLHYRINDILQCFAGGEIGTNMFGKLPQNAKTASVTDVFGKNFDMMDTFRFMDGSAFAGLGYILANNIDINLRYNLGLTSINKKDYLDQQPWKKNFITLSLGYTFRPQAE
jgi:hypothetical protein